MGNSTIKISLLLIFTNVTVLVKQKLFAMTGNLHAYQILRMLTFQF
jgi:hypothetical protein